MRELRSAVDMVRWGASLLAGCGVYCGHGYAEELDEALALTLHALHLPFGTPDAVLGGRLTAAERRRVARVLVRRAVHRVPVAYLTGEAWFAGHRFIADRRALVPRSPFAELIERRFEPWLEPDAVRHIADLGTGGGCIAIACALAFPDAEVDAVDVDAAALSLAAENVTLHGLATRVHLFEGDLFEPLAGRRYDLVVSNPPYVPDVDVAGAPAEFGHEPARALAAGESGMDVVGRILAQAPAHLGEAGMLFVEVGASWPAVEAQFAELAFQWVELERGGDGILAVERDALVLGPASSATPR